MLSLSFPQVDCINLICALLITFLCENFPLLFFFRRKNVYANRICLRKIMWTAMKSYEKNRIFRVFPKPLVKDIILKPL
jgi:hypothetical protein